MKKGGIIPSRISSAGDLLIRNYMSFLTYSTGEKLYYQKQPSTNLMRLYLLGAEVITSY